jgi:hypothetical protein
MVEPDERLFGSEPYSDSRSLQPPTTDQAHSDQRDPDTGRAQEARRSSVALAVRLGRPWQTLPPWRGLPLDLLAVTS